MKKAIWQGQNLKMRRKQLGLTMEQLANEIGCDRPLVSMWESGKSTPSGNFLVAMCWFMSITPKELFKIEEII